MIGALSAHASLFAASLISATLLPFQSEAVLLGLILAGHQPWALCLTASLGNTLGAVLNWVLGRFIARFRDRRWFPVGPEALARAEAWYGRYGKWSLLFSWLPVVGDPLTVVAGTLRVNLAGFTLLVAAGKAARYAAITAATLGWM